jgi:hypothetical protein
VPHPPSPLLAAPAEQPHGSGVDGITFGRLHQAAQVDAVALRAAAEPVERATNAFWMRGSPVGMTIFTARSLA